MKFKTSLIIALFVTSVLLFANAFSLGPFSQSASKTKSIEENDLKTASIFGVENNTKQISLKVSQNRLLTLLDNDLPDDSCAVAKAIKNNKLALRDFIDLGSDKNLIPASSNKLITAAVILSSLDPESTLDTELISEKKGTILSKGYLKTTGDPSFVSTSELPARRPAYLSPKNTRSFDQLAENIRKAGVKSITNLVIDTEWFDLKNVEPGWSEDKDQVGQISAFNVDEGFNGGTLSESPSAKAAEVFRGSLLAKGVTVGTISFAGIPDTLNTPEKVIAKDSSPTIETLVSDMLKTSDNVYAEQLLAAAVRTKFAQVNVENRKQFVLDSLNQIGVDSESYNFVNGSGYSTEIKTTCSMLLQVLDVMKKKGMDLAQLSSAAGSNGTLEERFLSYKGELFAKTGTLDGVTALTGLLKSKFEFSFIANGSFNEDGGKSLQQSFVDALNASPFVEDFEIDNAG